MIKNIFSTIFTRFINAIISFIVIIIISQKFGAEGTGTIGLILLGITIIVMINNFVGGSALVYLVPRYDLYKLLIPSYIWALITSVPVAILLSITALIPHEFTYHVMLLSLIFSLTSINQMFILGKEKINFFNLTSLAQMLVLLVSLILFVHFFPKLGIYAYIFALYCAYLSSLLWSTLIIKKLIKIGDLNGLTSIIKEFFRLGTIFQAANLFQLLNYRLAYYLVDLHLGRSALGVYNLGTQLAEGVWNIPKSLSTIIYSKISNSNDKDYKVKLTLGFFKLSLLSTLFLLIIILILPKSFFGLIFGPDFINVKEVIFFLATGITAISAGMILSHYFSGTGKPFHNTISSGIGLVFTFILCIILIPHYKLAGAAMAATISYTASCIYQIIIFCKLTNVSIKDFLPNKNDITILKNEIKNIFKKNIV